MEQSSATTVLLGGIAVLLFAVITPVLLFMGGEEGDGDTNTAATTGCNPTEGNDAGIPEEYQQFVEDAAAEAGLPVPVLGALFYTESGWDPNASSRVGAGGIAQFMDYTWAEYGNGQDRFDPQASIEASGRYLRDLQTMVGPLASTDQERIEFTLAAYNAGPGNVMKYSGIPPFAETQAYVPNILDRAQVNFSEDCTQPGGSAIGDLGSGEWTHPLPGGQVTSGFGPRPCPAGTECNQYTANHGGLDFSTGGGTTVVAATDIDITATGTNQYQGEYVIGRMTDDPHLVMQFHHCQTGSTSVSQGDTVAVGTALCTEGATGNASGPHLHFQINTQAADDTQPTYDHATDPQPILVEKGVL